MKTSPFTGGKVILEQRKEELEFRKLKFPIVYHYYKCEDTHEEFTDTYLDELNINQVYNKYRVNEGIPFPDEIKEIREKYNVSAAKMSQILGFGINMYGLYEGGEMPSVSNGRMINSCKNIDTFRSYVKISSELNVKEQTKIINHIEKIYQQECLDSSNQKFEKIFLGRKDRGEYTGYVDYSMDKVEQMILYFATLCEPFVTKMNKLLFYSDFLYFKRYGCSISGLNYIAIEKGPVPNRYSTLYDRIDVISKEEVIFTNGTSGEKIVPVESEIFDTSIFSQRELDVLTIVGDRLGAMKTSDIVKLSHGETAWIENKEKHAVISYDYGFELKAFG